MRYRAPGRSGLRVAPLSPGGNRLGDPGVDPDPAVLCAASGARTGEQLAASCAAGDDLRPEEPARARAGHAAWRAEGRW
jgi:hypothetical protein